MFIQTEDTPNPNSLKFIPDMEIMGDKNPINFSDKKSAIISPLASVLFEIDGVNGIFLGHDFITVTKQKESDWSIMKPYILSAIMDHFVKGGIVIDENAKSPKEIAKDEDPLIAQIKELIETRVRPAVAQDGGDIIFHSYDEGVVQLELHGSCSGCPSSTITLKNGIESMLKHYIPEIIAVEAV